jgi:uncharacterized membrane protein
MRFPGGKTKAEARSKMNTNAHSSESCDEHVGVIGSMHGQAEKELGAHQRFIERLTGRLGRPTTLYLLFGIVFLWAMGNVLAATLNHLPWDPAPFFWLQGAVAFYAASIGTIVLITQTRQQRHSEQRAYLELQINLTSEQKTAKVISLLEELRRDIPSVHNRVDLEAEAMTHAVDTKAVMTALASTLEAETE